MFTTAGSTRFTIPEKELGEGIGSGTASRAASVPPNDFIAETRPEMTEPIMIPRTRVNATKNDARYLRRRAQLKISFTCSPISLHLAFLAAQVCPAVPTVQRFHANQTPGQSPHQV